MGDSVLEGNRRGLLNVFAAVDRATIEMLRTALVVAATAHGGGYDSEALKMARSQERGVA